MYKVISYVGSDDKIEELEQEVIKWLDDGWELVGGVDVTVVDDIEGYMFCQTLRKGVSR